ncbi:hypothetical protein [Ferrimonas balearica]|uniref:hypothetical protein n=1 Tax=Ferrimonas balearica TaxID=44012 RepID=UPI001C998D14|nr:hypothetical protein [Ferrimonas balearica]MBY5921235.1 hypothetical protein [Ferrimonas balearica]MBY5996080.1 hypothetical protein [Ferrimonas balearica]
MKNRIALLLGLLPSLAYAHPGHGGLGLFHHAWDVMLMLLVAVALVIGWQRFKRR